METLLKQGFASLTWEESHTPLVRSFLEKEKEKEKGSATSAIESRWRELQVAAAASPTPGPWTRAILQQYSALNPTVVSWTSLEGDDHNHLFANIPRQLGSMAMWVAAKFMILGTTRVDLPLLSPFFHPTASFSPPSSFSSPPLANSSRAEDALAATTPRPLPTSLSTVEQASEVWFLWTFICVTMSAGAVMGRIPRTHAGHVLDGFGERMYRVPARLFCSDWQGKKIFRLGFEFFHMCRSRPISLRGIFCAQKKSKRR